MMKQIRKLQAFVLAVLLLFTFCVHALAATGDPQEANYTGDRTVGNVTVHVENEIESRSFNLCDGSSWPDFCVGDVVTISGGRNVIMALTFIYDGEVLESAPQGDFDSAFTLELNAPDKHILYVLQGDYLMMKRTFRVLTQKEYYAQNLWNTAKEVPVSLVIPFVAPAVALGIPLGFGPLLAMFLPLAPFVAFYNLFEALIYWAKAQVG